MENYFCQVSNCSEKVEAQCEGHSSPSYFCEKHYLIHKLNLGEHRPVDPDLFTVTGIRHFNLSESVKDTFIASFSSSIYIFKIQSVPITLPIDYKSNIQNLIHTFAVKVSRISGGKSDKIGKRVEKFLKALKQIIYNLKVDFISASKYIEEMHNFHQSTLIDNIIKHLNILLNNSISDLKMPPKAKKMFMFEVELESLRSPFISKCIEKKHITLHWFWLEILATFSLFIKEKPGSIPKSVTEAFEDYRREMEDINNRLVDEVKNFVFSLLVTLNYQRVGLFALKITENLNFCNSEWTLFASLILQTERVCLSQPVNLGPSSLLIPVSISGETLLVLYSDNCHASIIGRVESSSVKIAVGSTIDQIFISNNSLLNNSEFFIQMGRLKLKSEIDLKLKFRDKVSSIAYINSQKKLIYIVNKTDIHSKKLDSDKCVAINFSHQNQSLLSIFYSSELGYICLKTRDLLIIFNEHFQVIKQLSALGTQYFGLSIGIYGVFWVYEEKKATEFKFSLYKSVNDRNILKKSEIKSCKNTMSKDFLCSMPSGSKYTPFVQVDFQVPDFDPNFKRLMDRPDEYYLPLPVKFEIENSELYRFESEYPEIKKANIEIEENKISGYENFEVKDLGAEGNYGDNAESSGFFYAQEEKDKTVKDNVDVQGVIFGNSLEFGKNNENVEQQWNFEILAFNKISNRADGEVIKKRDELALENISNLLDKNEKSIHSSKDNFEQFIGEEEPESKLSDKDSKYMGKNGPSSFENIDDAKSSSWEKQSISSRSQKSSSDKFKAIDKPKSKISDNESSHSHISNSEPFRGVNELESKLSDNDSNHSQKSSTENFQDEDEPESKFSRNQSSHSQISNSDQFKGISEPKSGSDKQSSHSQISNSDPFQGINKAKSSLDKNSSSSHSRKSSSEHFEAENEPKSNFYYNESSHSQISYSDPFQGINDHHSKDSRKSSSDKINVCVEPGSKYADRELSSSNKINSDQFKSKSDSDSSSSDKESNRSNKSKSSSSKSNSYSKSNHSGKKSNHSNKNSSPPFIESESFPASDSGFIINNPPVAESKFNEIPEFQESNFSETYEDLINQTTPNPIKIQSIPSFEPIHEEFSTEKLEVIESNPIHFIETEELSQKLGKNDFFSDSGVQPEEIKENIFEESKNIESESEFNDPN